MNLSLNILQTLPIDTAKRSLLLPLHDELCLPNERELLPAFQIDVQWGHQIFGELTRAVF